MQDQDLGARLVLDGNAVGGELAELFGFDVTGAAAQCAHCGNVAVGGTLVAFTHGPGTVLRCSICREVVIRFVRTPAAVYLDVRGLTYLRRPAS